jgi:hypothetical protein
MKEEEWREGNIGKGRRVKGDGEDGDGEGG